MRGCVAYDCFGAASPSRRPAGSRCSWWWSRCTRSRGTSPRRPTAAPTWRTCSPRPSGRRRSPAARGGRRAAGPRAPALREVAEDARASYDGWRDAEGTDLAGADLRAEDLRGANLRGALLLGATLDGADLARGPAGADLRGASLADADLSRALFLTRRQLVFRELVRRRRELLRGCGHDWVWDGGRRAWRPATQLVDGLRSGDSQALGDLFEGTPTGLHVLLPPHRLVGDGRGRTSTVFLEAWRSRDRAEAYGGEALPWLYGIATNSAQPDPFPAAVRRRGPAAAAAAGRRGPRRRRRRPGRQRAHGRITAEMAGLPGAGPRGHRAGGVVRTELRGGGAGAGRAGRDGAQPPRPGATRLGAALTTEDEG